VGHTSVVSCLAGLSSSKFVSGAYDYSLRLWTRSSQTGGWDCAIAVEDNAGFLTGLTSLYMPRAASLEEMWLAQREFDLAVEETAACKRRLEEVSLEESYALLRRAGELEAPALTRSRLPHSECIGRVGLTSCVVLGGGRSRWRIERVISPSPQRDVLEIPGKVLPRSRR